MNHSFNIDIAAEVGVEAAIIFENILYWVVKNTASQENIREGAAWVYNSRSAWGELFPYLGEKQIRNAIERLLASGFITRDTFSFGSVNRTYWYTLAERAKPYWPKGPNLGLVQKGQTKTVIDPVINSTPPKAPKGAEVVEGFDEFWSAYPNKVGKPKALLVWNRLKPDLDVVMAGLKRWMASDQWTKDGGRYIPHPTTWLNREGWNDAIAGEKVPSSPEEIAAAKDRFDESERKHQEQMRNLVEARRRQLGMVT